MFSRFITSETNSQSHQLQGFFATSYALLDSGLSQEEEIELKILLGWFKLNLPVPDCFHQKRAVFWYRNSAHECLGTMWKLANILRSHSYAIEVQSCQRLCNIVYQDEFQVAAYRHQSDAKIISRCV